LTKPVLANAHLTHLQKLPPVLIVVKMRVVTPVSRFANQLNPHRTFMAFSKPVCYSNLAHLFLQETGKTNKLNSSRT